MTAWLKLLQAREQRRIPTNGRRCWHFWMRKI